MSFLIVSQMTGLRRVYHITSTSWPVGTIYVYLLHLGSAYHCKLFKVSTT